MEFLAGLICGVVITFSALLILGGIGADPDNW